MSVVAIAEAARPLAPADGRPRRLTPRDPQARKDQFNEGRHLLENAEIKTKIHAKMTARSASHDDDKLAAQLDKMIATYESTVKEIEATLATEPAPAGDADAPEAAAPAEAGAPPPKVYALNKYERSEFEDLLKAHKARYDALTAARDAAKQAKVPTHSLMTTPAEEDAIKILSLKGLVGSK